MEIKENVTIPGTIDTLSPGQVFIKAVYQAGKGPILIRGQQRDDGWIYHTNLHTGEVDFCAPDVRVHAYPNAVVLLHGEENEQEAKTK